VHSTELKRTGILDMEHLQEEEGEQLLCEGYLRKIRGWGQNRTRWFRLTSKELSFWSKDAGELLSSCGLDGILDVKTMEGTRFQVETEKPFGRSDNRVMVLEAPSDAVKTKWIDSLVKILQRTGLAAVGGADSTGGGGDGSTSSGVGEGGGGGGERSNEALLIEGYLTKMKQDLGSISRKRWFVITTQYLTYLAEEGGDEMARCSLGNITQVGPTSSTCFTIQAKEPFTKSGGDMLELQCTDTDERDKWLQTMRKVLTDEVVTTSDFTPLPGGNRALDDHFAVVVDGAQANQYLEQQKLDMEHSQGNRFISDGDL